MQVTVCVAIRHIGTGLSQKAGREEIGHSSKKDECEKKELIIQFLLQSSLEVATEIKEEMKIMFKDRLLL